MILELRCPSCSQKIDSLAADTDFKCGCGKRIVSRQGVFCFSDFDSFYEGKFSYTKSRRQSWLKDLLVILSINESENRTWGRSLKYISRLNQGRKLKILNIGAGGGEAILKLFGEVTSLDISLQSLMNAKAVSDYCVQGDATNLPFEDNQFDIVFSSHCLGHIPLDQKQRVIEEIYRVTKPNGFSLHSVETDADNFVFRKAKRYPELFHKNFVEMYGHYGLEVPFKNFSRFRRAGFMPVFERPDYCVGIIRPINSYKVFFGDSTYRQKSLLFRVLYGISAGLSSKAILQHGFDCMLRPLSVINWLFGPNSTDSIKILYQKQLSQ